MRYGCKVVFPPNIVIRDSPAGIRPRCPPGLAELDPPRTFVTPTPSGGRSSATPGPRVPHETRRLVPRQARPTPRPPSNQTPCRTRFSEGGRVSRPRPQDHAHETRRPEKAKRQQGQTTKHRTCSVPSCSHLEGGAPQRRDHASRTPRAVSSLDRHALHPDLHPTKHRVGRGSPKEAA
jgi:hypothetical protein